VTATLDSGLAVRIGPRLSADTSRTVTRFFVAGQEGISGGESRAADVITRLLALDDDDVERSVDDVMARFGPRHSGFVATLHEHADRDAHRLPRGVTLSAARRLLLGAIFTHEFSVEAAALCNPSMVPHPDQADLEPGQLRVAISLRQIGEGHISSIGFCSAVLGPQDTIRLEDRDGPLVIGERTGAKHQRDLLAAGLAELEIDNELTCSVLGSLPERYSDEEFEDVLGHLPSELLSRPTANETLEAIRRLVASDYAVTFPAAVPLHERVLWPATPAESNGMEDARFVQVEEADGRTAYHATYTAYDGRHIGGRMMHTRDLRHFEVTALRGPAARNKGMALFPRPVHGRHLALCRSDGETLGLSTRDEQNRWQDPVPLLAPHRGWDLIQVGNCGSPVETPAGWLVLTHGVGPMRRYAIGAMLLDLDTPERVIADLPHGLLEPDETEREGYVPNVVYSCGGLVHGGRFWLPYGASDVRVGFASIPLDELLNAMVPVV
jgi:predicted GH43/DUF377 family glycosyl hydrolase